MAPEELRSKFASKAHNLSKLLSLKSRLRKPRRSDDTLSMEEAVQAQHQLAAQRSQRRIREEQSRYNFAAIRAKAFKKAPPCL
jgi:hypothetical protein